MTDKQVFDKFMSWMNMDLELVKVSEGETTVIYEDTGYDKGVLTKKGYDEFYSGAKFDDKGKLLMGYLDSHVACCSANARIIEFDIKNKCIDR